ncbi:hypothetical protein VNI00_010263 [Paramarasmius palmivorus]|uniref:Uncharacterized protein n=1 Tax=Paramarasmius palmivorus TaxID=297713 RepID=A0AAW0CIT3_9AGAR
MGFLSVVVLLVVAPALVAQVLDPPPVIWNASVSQYKERLDAAANALNKGFKMLSDGGRVVTDDPHPLQRTFAFYSTLAQFDNAINGSKHYVFVSKLLKAGFTCPDCTEKDIADERVYPRIQLGSAVLDAYAVYNDDSLLERAKDYWEEANEYAIHDSNEHSRKNFSVVESCGKLTTKGAVFNDTGKTSPEISLLATGEFFRLSALLANAGSVYSTAAQQSGDFLNAVLDLPPRSESGYEETEPPIKVDSQECNSPFALPGTVYLSTLGNFIEGLSTIVLTTNNSTALQR